jgi:hypothetical protein
MVVPPEPMFRAVATPNVIESTRSGRLGTSSNDPHCSIIVRLSTMEQNWAQVALQSVKVRDVVWTGLIM